MSSLESQFIRRLLIMLPCLSNKSIHFIVKQGVLEGIQFSSAELVILDDLLDPLFVGIFLVC